MKMMFALLLFTLVLSLLLFASCGTEFGNRLQQGELVSNTLWEELLVEDSRQLEDLLTTDYELEELESFFCQVKGNNPINLSLEVVNNRFPVEVLRPNGYSVYRVRQGGYYYVFWTGNNPLEAQGAILSHDGQELQLESGPLVYFTAYLSSNKDKALFSSLKIGVSTIEDTYMIDPYAELVDYLSHATYSYSYLNERELLRISYTTTERDDKSYNLVCYRFAIVPRGVGENEARYSTLLEIDLPTE